jgi:serine protease
MKWLKRLFILSLVLTACGQPPQQLPPPTFTVDPSLQPSAPSLPGFENGEPRPVASVTGEDGVPADFVANEVWLSTDNEAELNAFLSRWQGKVVSSFNPADAGVTGLSKQYLIRINAAAADPTLLAEDLQKLDKTSTGDHKVSSQEALNLIAASSHEAASGLKIGMNWVGNGAGSFTDRTSLEAPSGGTLANVAYSRDAFAWPSHNRFSEQDIGVAEAWRALDLAGKLGNRIKLAVLDMGFQPDADWPAGHQAISNVPFTDAIGTENLLSCSGGSDCPWHGTEVVSAAMAVPDNQYGSAGPGGPVADAIVVFTLYDFFTSIQALFDASILGADIANMSYGAPVPWYLAWSVLPFEGATAGIRATGVLLFASAGNEGKNVDAEGCTFGVCWERTWYTPCENAGVICVGGLAGNSKFKAGGSNYGGEQVDIFAPYTLWLGPDPSAPDNVARVISGTSFSSPFTAGVAALIWAANPGLGAGEVEDILMETAHPNADDRVKRHVNALAAVQRVLGNLPPSINVNTAGGDVPLNRELFLSADVFDFEDAFPCCTITWTSDVDGPLGTERSVQRTFTTLGSRTLTITATDSVGATSRANVTLNVVNFAPVVALNSPQEGDTVFRTATTVLRGKATDRNEPTDELACDNLTWTSSVAGDPFPKTGCDVEATFSSNGPRTLTLTAIDALGATDAKSVNISVVDPPANLPPNVRVTSPENRASVRTDEALTLSGTAEDPEGLGPLTYQWTVQLFDNAPVVVGNAASVQWKPSDTFNFNSEGTYVIKVRLNVTDPQGNVGTDFITLEFFIVL